MAQKDLEMPSEGTSDGESGESHDASPETKPLLGGKAARRSSLSYLKYSEDWQEIHCQGHDEQKLSEDTINEFTYDPNALLTGFSWLRLDSTIWKSWSLWASMGVFLITVVAVTAIVVLLVHDPAALTIEWFLKVTYFLNFFVALLIGYFMRDSIHRWHECVEGFLELGDSIRKLCMQLEALGVPQNRVDLCSRYGLLSGWILKMQMVQEEFTLDEEAAQKLRYALCLKPGQKHRGCAPRLDPQELNLLSQAADPVHILISWIMSLLASMSEDGDIPAMPTPVFGRIMELPQAMYKGIRKVRNNVNTRTPFLYVRTLATIVQTNIIMNAICLGLVLGSIVSMAMVHHDLHYINPKVHPSQLVEDTGFGLVALVVCSFGPLIFLALTEVSIALSQPFATKFGQIPVSSIMLKVEEDLADMKMLTAELPHWKRPYFKHPA